MWNLQPRDPTTKSMHSDVQHFISMVLTSKVRHWKVVTSFIGPTHSLTIMANGDWELDLNNGTTYIGQRSHTKVRGERNDSDLHTFRTLYNKLVDRPQDYAA